MGVLAIRSLHDPDVLLTPKPGVEKSPFEIAVRRLEVDENVNRARLVRHFLALNLYIKQSYIFAKAPNECAQMEHSLCGCRAA